MPREGGFMKKLLYVFVIPIIFGCAVATKEALKPTTTQIQGNSYVFKFPKLEEFGFQTTPETTINFIIKVFQKKIPPEQSKMLGDIKIVNARYELSFKKSESNKPGCQSFLIEYSCVAPTYIDGRRTDIISMCISEDKNLYHLNTNHIETIDNPGRSSDYFLIKVPAGEPNTDLILRQITSNPEIYRGTIQEDVEFDSANTPAVVLANMQRLLGVQTGAISSMTAVGGDANFSYTFKETAFMVECKVFSYTKGSKIKVKYSCPVSINIVSGLYSPSTNTFKEFQDYLTKVFNS